MSAFLTFGGGPVQPARVRRRTITLDGNIELKWPWINADTAQIVAFINDVDPTGPGNTITMPPANEAPNGFDAVFFNEGAESFEVLDNDGNSITTVAPGLARYIYLRDNGDAAGEWKVIQFGAGGSMVDAAALAGNGLIALASRLHTNTPVNLVPTDMTLTADSRGQVFVVDPSAGSGTFTFDPVAALGSNGWNVTIINLGTGAWILDPSGDEAINNQPTLVLNPNQGVHIIAGDTAFFAWGFGGGSGQFNYTQNTQDVSGSGTINLTATQAASYFQKYTGTITGNRIIVVPTVVQPYVVTNATSGDFSLTVKTASGSGIAVPQNETIIIHCDGTNVVDSDTIAPSGATLQMPDGTVTAPGLAFADDLNTGFYRIAANVLGITADGALVARFGTDGVDVPTKIIKQRGLSVSMLAAAIG